MPQLNERERQRRGAGAATVTEDSSRLGSELLCTCCIPANPLVLRPDLGTEPDGTASWALCVFHTPEPAIYRARGDGSYELVPDLRLNELGEIVRIGGEVVARVLDDGFQRLTTVDDDDPPGQPGGGAGVSPGAPPGGGERPAWSSTRIDLAQDEFYAMPARPRCRSASP
ncbi:MAG: hypothetical protein FJ125_05080 [Deltaproteobacteria bacterium]|nr:hypothetical protein [Deltaproteobacteria bacterium]